MIDEQIKAFLTELTRFTRKRGVVIRAGDEGQSGDSWGVLRLDELGPGEKAGYYIVDEDDEIRFVSEWNEWQKEDIENARISGKPPED